MEKDWNRKQIEALLSGDEETQEAFIHEFAPVVYTWMYYQAGADEQVATELTSQALGQAVRDIPDFNPAEQTLFQRLKEQARQTRDEELEHRQMKPRRPETWSQMTKEVLDGLAKLSSESLPDRILENSFIHEIVQATLAELESANRELLIRRYNRLDTAEHIAEEMNCSVEDVRNRLYRCRHSFRRIFFQLVAAANPGFSESNATGEIETLNTNLEKLLSTTAIYLAPDEIKIDAIRQSVLEAIRETALAQPNRTHQDYYRLVAIALAVLILLVGLYLVTRQKDTIETGPDETAKTTKTVTETKTPAPKPDGPKTVQGDIDNEELKLVFALGQNGNVDALLEILKSGQFTSQAAAAFFIGKLADPSAIDLLEQAEEQWYDEPSEDNPFAKAIDEILTRFPDAAAAIAAEEPEPKPEVKKEPPAKTPAVTGIVSNFSNEPVVNAALELTENPLLSKTKAGSNLASAKTDPNGHYRFFDITYNGCVSLTCQPPRPNSHTHLVMQSLWCKEKSLRVVNIGGRPALTGTVLIDGMPLADQTLYLSDTLDMGDAAFTEAVLTDSQGNFSFLGVSPGMYAVLKGSDNRLHRLAMVEMPRQEIFNVNLNLETVTVLLDYPADPNLTGPTEAALVYAMDISENLNQTQAAIAEDGSVFFENIIPGSYVMRVRLDSDVWLQQVVEITDEPKEQVVQVDPVQPETTTLNGHFLGASPIDLFLTNANQQIHIDITPKADGSYELKAIPADIYSLAAFVHGQLIEFTQIDLQEEPEMTLDIDPAEMMQSFSPLNVVVMNETGLILSGAQIWLTGEGGDIITASSTGRGAFLAVPAGRHTLSAAYSGYPTQNLEITLKPSSLLAEPAPENTILVQLGAESSESTP
ncbi:MAG: hypothetical protein ABFR90_08500 [Planctomycetota bacterium]